MHSTATSPLTPSRSFDEFAFHLHTNTIGPIITANRLLRTPIPIGTIVFMSSDSGSHGNFREMEDGFAAYAASKAALNMAVRHLAAELKRKDDDTIILAMHPGEVATDMANVQLPWEVQGIISAEESVKRMIEVITSKGIQHSGTFWTYENKVSEMVSLWNVLLIVAAICVVMRWGFQICICSRILSAMVIPNLRARS
jgi:NAD(P)-dependent dehydrogenase (short-subunit alcohol dehydrogenase family)